MSGANIIVTLYQNGIHVTESDPAFFTDPALVAEMGRAFDGRKEDADARLGEVASRALKGVTCAFDCVFHEDKRGEEYTKPHLTEGDYALHHSGHFKW